MFPIFLNVITYNQDELIIYIPQSNTHFMSENKITKETDDNLLNEN